MVPAFEMYEKRFRSYVETCQEIPLGGYVPKLICPQTAWGIWVVRRVFTLFAIVARVFAWLNLSSTSDDQHPRFDLEIPKA